MKTISDIIKKFREKFGKASFDFKVKFEDTPLAGNIEQFISTEIKEFLVEEYKRGHNECLKEQGKVGDKYQHLYL